jgi:hypothetical protein
MENAVQETTIESQGTGASTATATATDTAKIGQGDYVKDAFSDYFIDPRDGMQGEDPKSDKDEKKEKEPKTDDKSTEPEKKPEAETTDDKNKKPDPFETAFSTESGDFDLEKLMGMSLDGIELKSEDRAMATGTGKPGGKPDIPQWKQEFEAERTFRESIQRARMGPLETVYAQIEEGEIPTEYKEPVLDVLRQEYARVRQDTERFFQEREQENSFKRRSEEQERLKEEIRDSKLPELSKTNAMAIIGKLPGKEAREKIDLYNRVMFGPDAGGELLEDMFQARYPDFSGKSKTEQDRMKLRFVNELQADGDKLQRHFNRAYRHLIASPENMKKIMGQISRTTDANARNNALAAQKKPDGAVQRLPQAGNSKWDGYFADPEGSKSRI